MKPPRKRSKDTYSLSPLIDKGNERPERGNARTEKGGRVGSGGATYDSSGPMPWKMVTHHEGVIGPSAHHNPFQAEPIAMDLALKGLPRGMRGRHVLVRTSNLGAVQAITRPKQQSGQQYIESIYRTVQPLKLNGNTAKTS